MVLLGATDKQKEKIFAKGNASLGITFIAPFIGLLGGGGWLWDPQLPSEKKVGAGAVLRLGMLGSPRRHGFQTRRVSHRVGRTWFCFGFGKGLAAFFQCWFNETQNRFP